jgi:hypothetical protein
VVEFFLTVFASCNVCYKKLIQKKNSIMLRRAKFFKSTIREERWNNFLSAENNQNFLTMLKSRLRRPDYFLPVHKKDRKAF